MAAARRSRPTARRSPTGRRRGPRSTSLPAVAKPRSTPEGLPPRRSSLAPARRSCSSPPQTTPVRPQIHRVGPSRPIETLTTDATDKVIVPSTLPAQPSSSRHARLARAGAAAAPEVAPATAGGRVPRSCSTSLVQRAVPPGRQRRDRRQLAILLPRRQHDCLRPPDGGGHGSLLTLPASPPPPHRRSSALAPSGSTSLPSPGRQPRRVPDDAARGLGALHRQPRWHRRDAPHARHQHDICPQFLTDDRLVGVIGEARHRRSFLYDLGTNTRTRLFHNNTVRTIAPEYSWKSAARRHQAAGRRPSATAIRSHRARRLPGRSRAEGDGRRCARASPRASPPRTRCAPRASGSSRRSPTRSGPLVADASVARIYGYEKALFDFDSKHISRPGNKLASRLPVRDLQVVRLRAEFQWFERANALGGKTANVVATLGHRQPRARSTSSAATTTRPRHRPGGRRRLVGHGGAARDGADHGAAPAAGDDRLRLVHGRRGGAPRQPRVRPPRRRRQARVVGALNNDMVGWANDQRLDSTIRYSNPGIRDIQHGRGDPVHRPHHLRRALLQGHRRRRLLRGVRRHRRRHRFVSGAEQPALPSVARRPREHEPSARHRGGQDDGGDADAAGVEPVAADGREDGVEGTTGRHGVVEAQLGTWRDGLPRLVWSARHARRASAARQQADRNPDQRRPGWSIAVKAVNANGLEGWDWARVTVK